MWAPKVRFHWILAPGLILALAGANSVVQGAGSVVQGASSVMQGASSVAQGASSVAQVVAERCKTDCASCDDDAIFFQQSKLGQTQTEAREVSTTTTTPDPTGMTMNAEGDLEIFITAVITNAVMAVVCCAIFMSLRLRFPSIYSYNVQAGLTRQKPADTYFSWISASRGVTLDEAIAAIGLDNAMMLEFTHLCMKILAFIAVPMFCIVGPMNWAFGGLAAGKDHLSYLSFGNVEFGSWLYDMHSFVVWYVVIVTVKFVYWGQESFLKRRFEWLRSLPAIRANTVLVEGIPVEYASDVRLAEFFNNILPGKGSVKKAYVAKDTSVLLPLVQELKAAQDGLEHATAEWEAQGKDSAKRPTVRVSVSSGRVDSIDYYTQKVKELKPLVQDERARVRSDAASGLGNVNLTKGFVTFNDRSVAEIAIRLDGISKDQEEWVLEKPPEPMDVQWSDFTQDPNAENVRTLIGYALVAGLYFAYLPLVISITNIAKAIDLGPIWAAFAPTLGLQVMVAFLPTFLILIFKVFFTLKAAAFAQHELQIYYFWFQAVFVIMAAAVGQNINGFMDTLVENPLGIFSVLADTMPYATHFYMNFMALQWSAHAMVLMRYVVLSKFLAFKRIFTEEQAKDMAEPEDQDYYGLGSRSARWCITFCIAIVFGTMSPPVSLLGLITFAWLRLIYGYLLVFAETRKPDLGGYFWVSQLRHIFVGLYIYLSVMVGVFMRRGSTYWPMVISASAFVYVFWSRKRFDLAFFWENLPFMECDDGTAQKQAELEGEYVQPEMVG